MNVGSLQIPPGALLAPMEAITDLAFRTVCEEQGAALTFTEFLAAEALTRGIQKTLERMWSSLGGRPFAVQIFGREPGAMAQAAELAARSGASLLDINMGCPAKRIVAGACGAALMREPELAADIVRAVRRALPAGTPLSVKHRAGWDERSLNAVDFARRMVDAGAQMITVHGRTRMQGFSGRSSLEVIAAVRAALPPSVPVIGNGDVIDVAGYLEMKRRTGCDAVMIGRGALGNPWLFRDVLHAERGEPVPAAAALDERYAIWRRHSTLVMEHAPQRMRAHELRKTIAWYSKGLWGGARARKLCYTMEETETLLQHGESFFATLQARLTQGGPEALQAPQQDPIQKAIARHARRDGRDPVEEDPCSAL